MKNKMIIIKCFINQNHLESNRMTKISTIKIFKKTK